MKRALITGIAGFAGSHLAEHLLAEGWNVAGIERHGAVLGKLAGRSGRVRVEECDILSAKGLGRVIRKHRPQIIFHLAGTSFVPSAQNVPQMAFEVNVKGSLNVLEESWENAPEARVILISSAEVYGKMPPERMPVSERAPTRPANVYGLTKLCAEEIATYYYQNRGLDCVILRPFSHIGPGQRPRFVTSAFALQIAEIEAGKKPPFLDVGNLKSARDFTDVRDMARAYRLAAERCEPGKPYNICSGKKCVIREILKKMLALTEVEIDIRHDPSRRRKAEVPVFQGDCTLFSKATGWKPEYDLDTTLKSILDYWRGKLIKSY